MRALLIVSLTWWAAVSVGRVLLDALLTRRDAYGIDLSPTEKFLLSTAIGLGTIAQGVLIMGLIGWLQPSILASYLAVVALAGISGARSTWSDLRRFAQIRREHTCTSFGVLDWAILGVLGSLLLIAVAACFQAPGAHAWDALAYHLADPKVYLAQHRIVPLPTEHHSNFPFTMEMLFTIGLAFDGYAAGNLFHLLTGVLVCLGIVCLCGRFLSRTAGLVGALVFASTPLVLWEASIAYIDLGLALYVFLAAYLLFLAIDKIEGDRGGRCSGSSITGRLVITAGVLMGLALGIKYLALIPLALFAALGLLRRLPMRQICAFVGAACAVGSPWYIKNVVWTHNPVYPFAFSLFPGTRYWSADRAAPYAEEQRSFGSDHSLARPLDSLRNIAAAPWRLVSSPYLYTNRADFTFTSLIGGLYAGLIFSILAVRGKGGIIRDSLVIVTGMFTCWFFVSQHIRYLIPVLPFAAVISGYALMYWLELARTSAARKVRAPADIVRLSAGSLAGVAVVGNVAVLFWGISALPVAGHEAALIQQAGFEPTALSIPEVSADLFVAGEHDRHARRLSTYGAAEWINTHTPRNAGVVLYEDVHGYYLNRPYLWGNGEHSSYIPYERMRSGNDLTKWLTEHGIRYALFNLNYAPANVEQRPLPEDADRVGAIMRQWYGVTGSGWRRIVGEAINSGEWTTRYVHHGTAILEIGDPKK